MSTLAPTPVTVLAAIDYSDTSTLVVQHAVEMAREKRAQELHFLHVRPNGRDAADDDACRQELEEWLAARLQGPEGVNEDVRVIAHEAHGNPAKVIVDMASELLASAVVVGTHGRQGMQRMVMGSVAEAVVRKAGCTVSVVRPMVHHDATPSIEPPCPRCIETRIQSGGDEYWCEQHAEKHGRRHTYYNTRLSTWVNQRITL
jgi:nucleotide-binding universal stress UspA family protein